MRTQGDLPFSGNFEPEKAGPFDARGLVQTKADLVNPTTWASLSGGAFVYVGMVTVVAEDPDETNNGIYRLTALPTTEETNWVKEGSSGGGSGGTSDYNELLNKPTINSVEVSGDKSLADYGIDIPENVSDLTNDSGFVAADTTALENYYNKTEIDAKVASVYRPMGSVADITALEAIVDPAPGDVYNVLDTGDNYAWVGPVGETAGFWDKLSGTVDLSNYVTNDTLVTSLGEKQDTLVAGTNIIIDPETNEISAEGGEFIYENPDKTVVAWGGIKAGTTLDGLSMEEIINLACYPELFPVLTAPRATFIENAPSLVEVNAATTINFTTSFNRGSIEPAYTTNGYRSGAPTQYTYTGPSLPPSVSKSDLTDTQVLTDYVITTPSEVKWSASVSYGEGEQPTGSYGTTYDTALSANTTQPIEVSVRAVYPHFATTADIATLTKQTLHYGTYYQCNLLAEDDLGNKQAIEYGAIGENVLSGIEIYNTNSGKWEWLSGSRDASKANFTGSEITKDVNGVTVTYRRYVNNSAKVGARQLRFYV